MKAKLSFGLALLLFLSALPSPVLSFSYAAAIPNPSLTNWIEKIKSLTKELNAYAQRQKILAGELREYEMRQRALVTELDLLLTRLTISQRELQEVSASLLNSQSILNDLRKSLKALALKHLIEKIIIGVAAGVGGAALGATGMYFYLSLSK
jgi:multidrug efflux pump subunit AcrA (membrane-fusion protein)